MPIDPFFEIATLLQPAARFSKLVEGAGLWRVRREASGEPLCCAVLEGRCRVTIHDLPAIILEAGDFLLVPAMRELTCESIEAPLANLTMIPLQIGEGHFRIGRQSGPPELRMRIGQCSIGSPDAALLVSLLPQIVLVRDQPRLITLMHLVADESRAARPGRELVLERLLEVLLIEALRCDGGTASAPGLARGLADDRLAPALRALHTRPEFDWTVAELAREAALSRSAFFARFNRMIGMPPMEYLLTWRIALAKRLLRERGLGLDQVARRVGYSSASTLSVAFARHTGMPPKRYARLPLLPSEDRLV